MGNLTRAIEHLADTGVPVAMPAAAVKHVRFCNLAAAAAFGCAFVFWILEMPIITDWGRTTGLEAGLILSRGVGVMMFLLPLRLNRHQRHAAARLAIMTVSLGFVLSSSVVFAASSPAHLFVIVIAAAALAVFPEHEKARMQATVLACVLTFGGMLWLRHRNEPLISVSRPEVRLAMEVLISLGALVLAIIITRALRATARR